MITTNIINKYDDIFKKAFEILEGHVTIEDNPYWDNCVAAGQMVNLDAYFISFGTLLSLVPDNEQGPFVLLPLDEPAFEINANTREIKIPDIFKKGIAVQGDCGSEILVFTIDRYFDYVDLNNMDIWIQYTTSDKQEKAYRVDLFDRESMPGKIRFGWLLGPDVTETSGALRFSIRFFKVEEANPSKVEYSFSTLSQTVNIYTALQPKINETTDGYTNALFKKVVRNSLDAGAIPADTPRFDTEPAIDLPGAASLVDDTLTLEALATATDNVRLDYEWFYSASGEDNSYTIIADNDTYTINNTSVKAVVNPKATNLIKYYTDEFCENEYTGDFNFEVETTLYKKITTCTINKDEEGISPIITGFYRVKAKNSLTATNKSNPVGSSICKLPWPVILEITDNLDFATDSVVLDPEAEIEPTITIKAKVDLLAQAICTWKHIPVGETEAVDKITETKTPDSNGDISFTYTPTEEGYYYAEITSLLNRTSLETKEEDKASFVDTTPVNAVRATNLPEPPVKDIDAPEDNTSITAIDGIFTVDSYINPNDLGHFVADKQTYVWKYVRVDDQDPIIITQELSSFVDGPVNEKVIKIKKNTLPEAIIIWCESFNTLNGKDSAYTESPTFILF